MNNKFNPGLTAAFFTIVIWSSTYISTKILTASFSAIQISFIRFSIGLIVLLFLAPPEFDGFELKNINWRQEGSLFLTGGIGIFLYYFIENLATKHTYASNVSVIVTSIPLITSLLAAFFCKHEGFRIKYLISFFLTMTGFFMILGESESLEGFAVKGDLLALLAAVIFSIYTLLLRPVSRKYRAILLARKTVFYGWILILLTLLLTGQLAGIQRFIRAEYLWHFLFLGAFASGFCFISWTYAVQNLGAVPTSQFIYLVPFITILLSVIFLHERLTVIQLTGMLFILFAVVFSQDIFNQKKGKSPLPAKAGRGKSNTV